MNRHLPFPLRDIQAAYWAGRTPDLVLGNVGAYAYYEYEAPGLNAARLEDALQRLIARHDALRLVVYPDGLQRVLPTAQYQMRTNDLTALTTEASAEQLVRIRSRLSQRILPLGEWPLFVAEVTLRANHPPRFHFGFDLMMCDAASFRILMRDLAQLYVDPSVTLPALTSTFREYVFAEQGLRGSDDYLRAREYWLQQLEELPEPPSLPYRIDPGTITEPQFVRFQSDIDSSHWSAIKAHASHHRVTPTAALLALYGETLARFSGHTRFTLNVPIFNRCPITTDVERVIGDFTSLIPIAIDTEGAMTFLGRVRIVQKQLWEALDHRIASDVFWRERSRRAPSYRAGLLPYVFTSILGLGDAVDDRPLAWPLPALPNEMRSQTPQVMIDLIVLESGGRLRWAVHYVDGLFHPETIDGIVQTISARLTDLENVERWEAPGLAIVSHDSQRLDPQSSIEIQPNVRLEELFLASAAEYPDNAAIITSDRVMSYRELERRSAALAYQIRNASALSQTVAVVIPKGWEQVAAVLSILRARMAYVPIDTRLPAARINALLKDSGATIVLTRSDVDPWMEWPKDVTRILVDCIFPSPDDETDESVPASSDSLAYVIYTSGSTGSPKGVMISHRGAVNTILEINRMCELRPTDRVLAVSALGFDLSVFDVFGTLAAGAAIVMPDSGRELSVNHWLTLIATAKVTVWNSVPALLQLLLDDASDDSSLSCLRLAMVSGDWIPLTLPASLRRMAPEAQFLAMGGATEASIWSIYKWISDVDPEWSSIPYGRPLANQSVHVLDSRLDPCPVWTPGELYIGGVGVALGYWNDPDRTSTSFVIHPQTRERLYRTGDFGRYLPNDEIEFLGRRDAQVKIFGQRIELGEVESTLLKHQSVQQCIAVAIGEHRHLTGLVAYVVLSEATPTTLDELRFMAAAQLPPHMVPREIVTLAEWPLTSNGKIDRERLREHATAERPKPPYVAPRNDVEGTIASYWMEVLQVDRVGVHDDFFELGGDSFAATRIISRINTTFGCSKSFAAVFDHPTISELCSDIAIFAGE